MRYYIAKLLIFYTKPSKCNARTSNIIFDLEVLDQSRTFGVSRLDCALKRLRPAGAGVCMVSIVNIRITKPHAHLVNPSVYLILPISRGFPRASRGAPMSNTAKMFDIWSHRLWSMK